MQLSNHSHGNHVIESSYFCLVALSVLISGLLTAFRIQEEFELVFLRGPSTLTWELRTGDCKTTLEDKQKIGNVTYYISSESLRDAESE